MVLLWEGCVVAYGQDSIRTTLREVSIRGNRTPSVTEINPTQFVGEKELERQGAITIGDAVRHMAGLTLKDYGGVGGMKTVSIRGLGSQFSTLTIDGVAVNDAQNGQVDLGRYQLGGVSYVSMSQGQDESPLLPARSYAAGSVINMESISPTFYGRRYNLSLKGSVGSFGMLSPVVSWEQKLSRRWSMSLYGNYLKSRGDYPFTLYYGTGAGDSTSRERRQNSQMSQGTVDMNLYGVLGGGRTLTGKVHYVRGYHALPGPVTYYTTKGSEHSEEELFFVQGRYKHVVGPRLRFQVVGKYRCSNDVYEDTAARTNAQRLIHNEYHQQEGYVSQTMNWRVAEHGNLYVSNDVAYNRLESNLPHFNEVGEWADHAVVGGVYRNRFNRWIEHVEGNLLSTWTRDDARTKGSDEERVRVYRQLSPYVGVQVTPFKTKDIRVRYFFKETYRTPSFSENFYFTLTRDLMPERALQNNLGVTCRIGGKDTAQWWDGAMQLIVDVYFNRVTNKIIAIPTQNMFLWSMINLGKVEIVGGEVQMEKRFRMGDFELNAHANYSYQHAVDKTDPEGKTYDNQIPYTPRHSGTLQLTGMWDDYAATLTTAFVGSRWSMQQNTEYNRLHPYTDIALTLSKEWKLRHCNLGVSGGVMNLLDIQYEVVKSYPMMGRNYRVGVSLKL